MDTEAIKAFLAVVHCGSLTEAANSLYLSQSTLSHRLAELEKEIGMSLIERRRGIRSLALTDHGKEFLLVAKRWEALVQDTERLRFRTQKTTLSIGSVDTIHTFVLPPVYQLLRQYSKDISFRLSTYNSTELYLKVDRGEIDVAFPLLDLPMRNIVVKKFYAEPRVVLRKEAVPGKCGEVINLANLNPETEVFFEGDPLFHNWYQRWKGESGYPSLQVDTAQLLVPLLSTDEAWSVLPWCIAQKLLSAGSYSYYILEDTPPERVCYKIQAKYPKPGASANIELLDVHLESLLADIAESNRKK
jgi:DNA-binding transcriptional LysR family regulator